MGDDTNGLEVITSIPVEPTDEQYLSTATLDKLHRGELDKAKVMKKESDGEHPSSHYLVVEDPAKPTTWHLRVKDASGKLDHNLMGGAWAALHQGHRGNKYTGPNKAQAIAKLKKLYDSEGLAVPGQKDIFIDGVEAEVMIASMPPTTFEELEAQEAAQEAAWNIRELTDRFQMLVSNVMLSGDTDSKVASIKKLAGDFSDRIGQVTANAGEAKEKKPGLIERAVGAVKDVLGIKPEPTEPGNLMFYKEGDTIRWLGVYSNKFLDSDNPPDILASQAHQDFVKAVTTGEWPYPTFRLWHIPIDLGVSDWVGYDDSGFAMATGTIFKEFNPIIEFLLKGNWLMSHGMPYIERDEKERRVITKYRTSEISALPTWAAANKLTSFFMKDSNTGGDKAMALTAQDKEKLSKMFGDDGARVVEIVETGLAQRAVQATDAGIPSKEVTPAPVKEETPAPAVPLLEYATKVEVVDALKPLMQGLSDLTGQVTALLAQMEQMKSAQEQIKAVQAEPMARTPSASISELLIQSITHGHPTETRLQGRLPKDLKGPTETQPTATIKRTGVPFIDTMLTPEPK